MQHPPTAGVADMVGVSNKTIGADLGAEYSAPISQNQQEFAEYSAPAIPRDDFNPEERKQIAELVKELQPKASQRAIADMVGVSHTAIQNDLDSGNKLPKTPISEPDIGNKLPSPAIPRDDFNPVEQERKKRQWEDKRLRAQNKDNAPPLPNASVVMWSSMAKTIFAACKRSLFSFILSFLTPANQTGDSDGTESSVLMTRF